MKLANVSCVLLTAVVSVATATGCVGDADAPPEGRVTVLVADGVEPVAGVPVVFQGPDGAVLFEAFTGADGAASFNEEPRGGMVTMLFSESGTASLLTVADLEPGDVLVFASVPEPVPTPTPFVATIALTWPPLSGADAYLIRAGCGEAFTVGTSAVLDVTSPCVTSDDTYEVMAHALDPAGTPLAFALETPVATSVSSMALAWQTDFSTLSLTLSNPPTGTVEAEVRCFQRGTSGTPFLSPGVYNTVIAEKGSTVVDVPYVPGYGTQLDHMLFLFFDQGYSAILHNDAGFEDTFLYDLDVAALPRIFDVGLSGSTTRPVVSWNRRGPVDADAGSTVISWNDASGGAAWQALFSPNERRSFKFPALPDSMANVRPPEDIFYGDIAYYDASFVDGYDGFRAELTSVLEIFYGGASQPSPSTLRISAHPF